MLRFEWIWMKIDAKILLIGTESTLKSAKKCSKRNRRPTQPVHFQNLGFMIEYSRKQARGFSCCRFQIKYSTIKKGQTQCDTTRTTLAPTTIITRVTAISRTTVRATYGWYTTSDREEIIPSLARSRLCNITTITSFIVSRPKKETIDEFKSLQKIESKSHTFGSEGLVF